MPPTLLLLLPVALLACDGKSADDEFVGGGGTVDGVGGDDSGALPDVDPLQEACTTGEEGEATAIAAARLSATVTWTLSFDAAAEAAGFFDCTYTRAFDGVQVRDIDYTCPDCSVITRGDAVMTDGADCHAQLTGGAEEEVRTELWGLSDDGRLFRSGRDQFPAGELTTFTPVAEGEAADITWDSTYELDGGGVVELAAAGTFTTVTDPDTLVTEPFGPRTAPYSCGWECTDPGTLDLDYAITVGGTLPNVRLDDACGEAVDLWDFYGSYIVLDLSQPDCGPCQSMAKGEHDFVMAMRAKGIPVRVVTLLGQGLSYPYLTPTPAVVNQWIGDFGVEEPVLADRGYGYSLFATFTEEAAGESFGYPTWVIIDPEMKIRKVSVGFSKFDPIIAAIEEIEAGG